MNSEQPTLAARGVSRIFPERTGAPSVTALDDVTVEVRRGETLGVVGESGSGKSTLMRLLLDLDRANSGTVEYEGRELTALTAAELRGFRRAVSAVFQNPYSSLDPRMRIWDLVTEKQAIGGRRQGHERRDSANELLGRVGLDESLVERYPHQLSGGQRQRVAIARAIDQEPDVIVLDEPLSALDVSVGAQILNLLLEIQEALELTYVVVGHDLRQIRHLSHRVVVMHRGRVVETGTADDVLLAPRHPYTAALVEASMLRSLPTDVAPSDPAAEGTSTPGCTYRHRCPSAQEDCAEGVPPLRLLEHDRQARCLHPLNPGAADEGCVTNLRPEGIDA